MAKFPWCVCFCYYHLDHIACDLWSMKIQRVTFQVKRYNKDEIEVIIIRDNVWFSSIWRQWKLFYSINYLNLISKILIFNDGDIFKKEFNYFRGLHVDIRPCVIVCSVMISKIDIFSCYQITICPCQYYHDIFLL